MLVSCLFGAGACVRLAMQIYTMVVIARYPIAQQSHTGTFIGYNSAMLAFYVVLMYVVRAMDKFDVWSCKTIVVAAMHHLACMLLFVFQDGNNANAVAVLLTQAPLVGILFDVPCLCDIVHVAHTPPKTRTHTWNAISRILLCAGLTVRVFFGLDIAISLGILSESTWNMYPAYNTAMAVFFFLVWLLDVIAPNSHLLVRKSAVVASAHHIICIVVSIYEKDAGVIAFVQAPLVLVLFDVPVLVDMHTFPLPDKSSIATDILTLFPATARLVSAIIAFSWLVTNNTASNAYSILNLVFLEVGAAYIFMHFLFKSRPIFNYALCIFLHNLLCFMLWKNRVLTQGLLIPIQASVAPFIIDIPVFAATIWSMYFNDPFIKTI